jgi:hypothetical protein
MSMAVLAPRDATPGQARRPFTRSEGGWPRFPKELLDYDNNKQQLHGTLRLLRPCSRFAALPMLTS